MDAVVHDLNRVKITRYPKLAAALRHVEEHKVTGYVVTPDSEVINVRKGKRKSADGKKWVPCALGY